MATTNSRRLYYPKKVLATGKDLMRDTISVSLMENSMILMTLSLSMRISDPIEK